MFHYLRWVPLPPATPSEAIVTYEFSRNFYREVAQRQAFADHCQWYHETAAKHQQELESMRGDINILGWFSRR